MTRYDELLKEGQAVYRTRVPDRKTLATQPPRPMTDAQRRRYDELLEEGRAAYRTAKPVQEHKYPQWVYRREQTCRACDAGWETIGGVRLPQCPLKALLEDKPCSARRQIFEGAAICPTGRMDGSDKLKISAIITGRDEGEEVRLTVESLLAARVDEIVIIDDGSTDGSCDGLASERVTVIRNDVARGVNKARNQGARVATGEVLVFCDAHIRVDSRTFRSFAAEAHRRQAFICAACGPLNPEDGRDFTFYGATLVVDGDKKEHLQPKHNNSRPATRFSPVTCSLGACYAVARPAYDKMGGWVDTFAWGYSEQGLGLKCFLCDVPLLADRDCRVLHKFKKQFNYPVSRDQLIHVALHTYKVIFEDETYRDVWVPRMLARWGSRGKLILKQVDADSEIQKEAQEFKPRRTRNEAELIDWLLAGDGVIS